MNITQPVQDIINRQINMEFNSAYSYLAMAAYFESRALQGFAKWMRLQSEEENVHAMKFFDYLHDRGGQVTLLEMPKPRIDFSSPLEVFQVSLDQEEKVTASIYDIYELAHNERDYATVSFLKWFNDEQVEEERSAADMVQRLELAGDNPEALLLLDQMAGQRSAAE
ncbi:MAG: ferritin [Puniceicoccaceae bacterium]|nr:MAG: ferritin [Puniceicoccaceae bacterium]